MAEYIVHKAVELSKVKKARQAILSQPGYLEKNFIAQAKYDGCNTVAHLCEDVGGSRWVRFESRTGEHVLSLEHINMAMCSFRTLPLGVYLGEAWAPDLQFNDISGIFRRQRSDEESCRLQFAIFDYITDEEWEWGQSQVTYADRVARLPDILSYIPRECNPLWLAQSFGKISETWSDVATAQQVCNRLVEAGGYDGLILRDPEGLWRKGDGGSNGEIIKIKRKLSFDLEVIGYEPGKGKHAGKIGSLIVRFQGQAMGAGTGLRDSERDIGEFAERWLGKIVEVEAMDYSSDGLLREPRLKGVRHDKVQADA